MVETHVKTLQQPSYNQVEWQWMKHFSDSSLEEKQCISLLLHIYTLPCVALSHTIWIRYVKVCDGNITRMWKSLMSVNTFGRDYTSEPEMFPRLSFWSSVSNQREMDFCMKIRHMPRLYPIIVRLHVQNQKNKIKKTVLLCSYSMSLNSISLSFYVSLCRWAIIIFLTIHNLLRAHFCF